LKGITIKRRIIPWLRSASDGGLLQSRIGTVRTVKVEGLAELSLARDDLGFAQLLQLPVGQLDSSPHIVVEQQELTEQTADCEPAVSKILDSDRAHQIGAHQFDHSLEKGALAITAASFADDHRRDLRVG
jgi:hypothetical protein